MSLTEIGLNGAIGDPVLKLAAVVLNPENEFAAILMVDNIAPDPDGNKKLVIPTLAPPMEFGNNGPNGLLAADLAEAALNPENENATTFPEDAIAMAPAGNKLRVNNKPAVSTVIGDIGVNGLIAASPAEAVLD